MVRKSMQRADWRCMKATRYVSAPGKLNGRDGVAGLILMDLVEPDRTLSGPFGPVTIAKSGFSWLEFAPGTGCFFLTSQFDEQDRLIQIYFDITLSAGICFDPADNPSFEDAYLDVIWDPLHGIAVTDRDELTEAAARGEISQEEQAHALAVCDRLTDELKRRGTEIAGECAAWQKAMKARLMPGLR